MDLRATDVLEVLTPHAAKTAMGYRPESNVVYIYPKRVTLYRPNNEPKWIQRRIQRHNIVALYIVHNAQLHALSKVGYRKLNAANMGSELVAVDSRTYSLVDLIHRNHCECHDTLKVILKPVPWYLRPFCVFCMNWSHPDDAARIAFKVGVAGILLGLISLDKVLYHLKVILRYMFA